MIRSLCFYIFASDPSSRNGPKQRHRGECRNRRSSGSSLRRSSSDRTRRQPAQPGQAGGGQAGQQPAIEFASDVRITADPATNALIVTAAPEDYAILLGVIDKLDIRRRQVYVEAIILLLLSLSDQLSENIPETLDRAWGLLSRLGDEYLHSYYQGILFERQARVYLRRASPGSGFSAYDLLREAMRLYEKAELLRPAGNDEALLRWNTCARTIMLANLQARPLDDFLPMLE